MADERIARTHPLRRERVLRGWSQQYVADAIEAPDASYVSRWERGVISPSPHYQERLCRLFGKNAEELGMLDLPPDDGGSPPGPAQTPGAAAPTDVARWRSHPRLLLSLTMVAMSAVVAFTALTLARRAPAPPSSGGAMPATYGCPSARYCFYAAPGFAGRRLDFRDCGTRQSLDNYGFAMRTSSWVNTTAHTIFVYDNLGTLLWKEEPRSESREVGAARNARAWVFDTVC